ncbi:ferric reductase-like transmembrane domain-containing protein [Enterovibrio sp. ZSDZ35]|uniref:Ferric reductase-like transmembrane domain-containing protein n=1 Tax=Enterovibrio qingdaonensis TaxID=2899818 RepID=A0ABT5QP10_9GAMM|nr:ferric reductase-like transmembrane domain-containing protein [Enterovibrio sp. ZSDZ35]MDD1782614.1 ferric reductase-like transmembrane domain-containing protein [Enterovibrio sp. ZSDZ35]
MNNTLRPVWLLLSLVSALWFLAEPELLTSTQFFYWRAAIIQYSGIISILLMSLTMILALRLPMIEQWTQGLDKSYRLHKWLGIGAAGFGIAHWLWYQVPKWMVMAAWLTRPSKPSGASSVEPSQWQEWLLQLREPAMEIGEKGFYLLLILVVVSLWAALKYKPFKLSHKLMAFAYLLIAFHSALLLKASYWANPISYITLAAITLGSIAALYSLFGFVGRRQRAAATVTSTCYFPASRTLLLSLKPDEKWAGHQAGQFAYLRVGQEEPHPFTIVSSPEESEVRFLIKELGDFTTGLHQRIAAGDNVELEGPYGKLNFDFDKKQIWVAGGVGVASFLAALAQRKTALQHAGTKNLAPIHVYYSTRDKDDELEAKLHDLCIQEGVILRIIESGSATRLNAEQLQQNHGDLADYEVYFCGPEAFSKALRLTLPRYGLDVKSRFHEELFAMR